ncbi:hypothetical protein [Clostridium sardiniense]|uniref:hypothetical protein n=1 Tax=Clostridium sardiniense TaxID=29369 RepID=UPI003D34EA6D
MGNMKRKSEKNIIAIILVMVVITSIIVGSVIYNYIKKHNIYSNIIESSWGIELSKNYDELYATDSGESFLGDGQRYHVFKFKDTEDLNIDKRLSLKNDKDEILEANIEEILKNLSVAKENYPDFNKEYSYYFKTEEDSSKLYMVNFKDSNTLYVVEDIY